MAVKGSIAAGLRVRTLCMQAVPLALSISGELTCLCSGCVCEVRV